MYNRCPSRSCNCNMGVTRLYETKHSAYPLPHRLVDHITYFLIIYVTVSQDSIKRKVHFKILLIMSWSFLSDHNMEIIFVSLESWLWLFLFVGSSGSNHKHRATAESSSDGSEMTTTGRRWKKNAKSTFSQLFSKCPPSLGFLGQKYNSSKLSSQC